jgi:hypothetical protein
MKRPIKRRRVNGTLSGAVRDVLEPYKSNVQ